MSDLLALANEKIARQEACAFCTVIRTNGSVPRRAGSKMLVSEDGSILGGTIGGGEMENRAIALAREAMNDGEPRTMSYSLVDPTSGDPGVCGGSVELFIEPLLTMPKLIVIGAGHVGRALIGAAKLCGFHVTLMDDRAELCNAQVCAGADTYLAGEIAPQLATLKLNPQTYVALVTRNSPMDVAILPTLLRSNVAYIGAIGSKRRWLTTVEALGKIGISADQLKRVHAPIGLEIEAETPEEIAVSILAQMIQVRRER